jgi:arylsulfatase A-like enzyme
MEQGFETFREASASKHWRLARTLAQAEELALADDGRPLFLFVHTYRTHTPYRVGPDEDDSRFRALRKRAKDERDGKFLSESQQERLRPIVDDLRALYREGARQLDAELGPWFERLERRGFFRAGLFVFTSDHGEEFQEHGGVTHSGMPHEELARVPLFFFGGGIEPGDVRLGASLVDVAPTLAARCGVERAPAWVGADLFRLSAERILFSSVRMEHSRLLTVVNGAHKLLAEGSPDVELPRHVTSAFDLAVDPGERDDVRGTAGWPDDLARAAASEWERIRLPLAAAPDVELDAERLDELRAMGYGE